MKVANVYNKVVELTKSREQLANALALAMTGDSPQSVIDSLAKDYKKVSNEYFKYMEQDVEVY